MFDITSSKLLLLAVVALLVIGPKDFPVLLRTIGKYVGIIRGHAKEFRAQFDEAMRESELTQLKKDMENLAQETEASLNKAGQSVEQTFAEAQQSVEASVTSSVAPAADPASEAAGASAEAPPPSIAPEAATAELALPDTAAPDTTAPEPEPAAVTVPASEPAQTAQPAVERTGA
jgi:sec-independent protein translocase protein TatB